MLSNMVHALINSCMTVTYPYIPRFPLPLYLALVSSLGVLRTTYILRGCPNPPNYRTEGATNYHNASRKKKLGLGEWYKPYIALALD